MWPFKRKAWEFCGHLDVDWERTYPNGYVASMSMRLNFFTSDNKRKIEPSSATHYRELLNSGFSPVPQCEAWVKGGVLPEGFIKTAKGTAKLILLETRKGE
jgi:hypothetical protein